MSLLRRGGRCIGNHYGRGYLSAARSHVRLLGSADPARLLSRKRVNFEESRGKAADTPDFPSAFDWIGRHLAPEG